MVIRDTMRKSQEVVGSVWPQQELAGASAV
jgi:hypothetical protein